LARQLLDSSTPRLFVFIDILALFPQEPSGVVCRSPWSLSSNNCLKHVFEYRVGTLGSRFRLRLFRDIWSFPWRLFALFCMRYQFVLSSFFDDFIDSKGVVEFVPTILNIFFARLFSSIPGLRTRASLCWLSGAYFGGHQLLRKSHHSRESGSPLGSPSKMDPRLRGGDDKGSFQSLGWAASP